MMGCTFETGVVICPVELDAVVDEPHPKSTMDAKIPIANKILEG
jgi:hypothetical protein